MVDRKGGRHLVRLKTGADFHFHDGVIAHDQLIGLEEGSSIASRLGRVVTAYRPRMHDYLLEMPRASAVIYPKDVAFLLMWGDIFPGARVFEAGVGSGAVAISLLRSIGPTGHLVTYDRRADMIERATANAQAFLGETPNWTLRQRDLDQGIDDGPFDRMVFDIPDPGAAAEIAAAALVPGGIVTWFVPNVTQIRTAVEAFQATGVFGEIESYENFLRPWEFQGRTARPARRMISHTGFLGVARKRMPLVNGDQDSATAPELDNAEARPEQT